VAHHRASGVCVAVTCVGRRVRQAVYTKGCDASNAHDEEAAQDEMEYSDDEQEAAARAHAKAKRKKCVCGGRCCMLRGVIVSLPRQCVYAPPCLNCVVLSLLVSRAVAALVALISEVTWQRQVLRQVVPPRRRRRSLSAVAGRRRDRRRAWVGPLRAACARWGQQVPSAASRRLLLARRSARPSAQVPVSPRVQKPHELPRHCRAHG
jgi:hypothetical protein